MIRDGEEEGGAESKIKSHKQSRVQKDVLDKALRTCSRKGWGRNREGGEDFGEREVERVRWR